MNIFVNCPPKYATAYQRVSLPVAIRSESYWRPRFPFLFRRFSCLSRTGYDLVINHWQEPILYGKKKTLGALRTTRMERLQIAERCGVPIMEWGLARDREEVRQFFAKWNQHRIILKHGSSTAGERVFAFGEKNVDEIQWDPQHDIFCKDVNPDLGDVYKLESLAGELILGWMSEGTSFTSSTTGLWRSCKTVYGDRALWDIPIEVREDFAPLLAYLKDHDFGYVSIDLMKDPEGTYRMIELNDNYVALWWSGEQKAWPLRVTEILQRLIRA